MNKQVLTILFFVFFLSATIAQTNDEYVLNKSELTVKGTSSLHDWEMIVQKMTCNTSIKLEDSSISIQSVSFTCESSSLKSEHKLMDKKAHEALKAKKFPVITFNSGGGEFSKNGSSKLSGNLTVAGKTKPIDVKMKLNANNSSVILVSGNVSFKMSDFDIEAPTALMGTIKTGDAIQLEFRLSVTKKVKQ